MRSLILAFICLLLSFAGFSQNYNCFLPLTKQYFVNSNGYLRGMRIDSVRASGSDTLYYPFHTPRGSYHTSPFSDTLDATGGSWLGKAVIKQAGGTFLFDNMWADTVIIKTQAHTGDAWVFYSDTTAVYYMANLVAEDTMSISGAVDSVKKITISVFNASGALTSDSINHLSIILSRNHGFVQVFDLYTFPFHAPGTPYTIGFDYFLDRACQFSPGRTTSIFSSVDLINPTIAQLYDWRTGDVYEYSMLNPVSCPINPVVREVITSYCYDSVRSSYVLPDSTTDSCAAWVANIHFDWTNPDCLNGSYDFYYAAHSLSFRSDFFLIDSTLMPEELGQSHLQYYLPGDTSYCTNTPLYSFSESEIIGNVWENIHFESSGPIRTFKLGLGLVKYYLYDAGRDVEYDSTLIYYRRSGSVCGSYVAPTPTAVSEVHLPSPGLSLSPNPATTLLSVSANEPLNTLTIYDLVGNVILEQRVNTSSADLDVSMLPPGMYFLRANDLVQKFIKQ